MTAIRETPSAGAGRAWLVLLIAAAVVVTGDVARAQTGTAAPTRTFGATSELTTMMLVRSDAARAVVRFGDGPLEVVAVGDTLGREKAKVARIGGGLMVLVGASPGKDGKPVHAEIVIRDGERGGKRYLAHPGEPPPSGRLNVIEPDGKGAAPKKNPAPKKPSARSETP